MKRSGPINRTVPMKKRRPDRLRKRRQEEYGGPYADWIRSQGCAVCRHHGIRRRDRIEAAHARSRGAGGKEADLVGLCETHHRVQHEWGIRTFETYYAVDLRSVARRLWDTYQEGK